MKSLRMRRLVVILVLVCLPVMAFCSGTSPDEQSEAGEATLDTLYEVNVLQWGPRDIDPDDGVIAFINEKFNIDLGIERFILAEYRPSLELRIASGDLPDLFRTLDNAPDIYNNLYEDNYLASYSEFADQYDLDSMRAWFATPGVDGYSENGEFYRLPTRFGPASAIGFVLVRQDWLDAIDADFPATYDELKAVLAAFKDQNLGGENTIPLTGSTIDNLEKLIAGFHGAYVWKHVDGVWTDVRVADGFRDGLRFLNELYREGLIDTEYFALNETQARGKFANGTAGMVIPQGGMADRYVTYSGLVEENFPDARVSLMDPMPAGPEGTVYMGFTGLNNSVLIPKFERSHDFVARLMMLMDFAHSEEGVDILQHGVEGFHYSMQGNTRVTNEAFDRDIIPGLGHMFAMCGDYATSKIGVNEAIDQSYDIASRYAVWNPLPSTYYNEIVYEYQPFVNEVYSTWFAQFVTGSRDLETEWDDYLDAMAAAGLDMITAEVNDYLSQNGPVVTEYEWPGLDAYR